MNKHPEKPISELANTLNFYEYYKGTFLIPFGEAGTVHFIENKEDPGGFSSEELIHYYNYRIATFNLKPCINDSLNYYGEVVFYQNDSILKTETLLNLCK